MDYFKQGWEIVKPNIGPWIILVIVLGAVSSVTGGLGMLILMPNAYRVVRKARAENAGPELGGLFNFDRIGDDLVAMLLQMVANMVGMLICCVGMIATGVLFSWVPFLLAEDRYKGMASLKASMAHAKQNFGKIIVFMLIAMVVNTIGMLVCYVGLFVTMPVTLVAQWLFYEANRDEILRAAQEAGVENEA
jgi:uncharacterized membrane protein